MKDLIIEATKYTPKIEFLAGTGKLTLSGSSYPENSVEFYQPVIDWINEYIETQKTPMEFNFKITYFNTSTSKCFLIILEILESFYKKGGDVIVKWHFQKDDDDILESGEELFVELELPHKYIPY
ncbi:MAG: DUF1987 domain-containing protein [Bacteroidota bacterium]